MMCLLAGVQTIGRRFS